MAGEEVSMLVVLCVYLATGLEGLTDPAFIASMATLITALTGLVVALRAQAGASRAQAHVATTAATVAANSNALEQVRQQTNGSLAELQAQVYLLRKQAEQAGLPPLPTSGQDAGTTGSASSG